MIILEGGGDMEKAILNFAAWPCWGNRGRRKGVACSGVCGWGSIDNYELTLGGGGE